jgi:hypothetical protein
MKFNKWTLGLAAVGVVSLASAARADEKMNSLQTALSNTTISGSVSASMNWALTPGANAYQDSPAQYIPFQGPTKQDGFNLDVVRLTIAKPEDESPWASGYQVDLMFGPDAVGYNPSSIATGGAWNGGTSSDFAIKQAYVTLRTPVGNGIDWKVGVFDTVIGYEVTDAGNDPNYTRSYGYAIEPTEHTGVLATYAINSEFTVSAGIANTLVTGINTRDYQDNASDYWHKTLMGSLAFTAPSSWGWAAGSSMYAGVVYGYANGGNYAGGNQVNYYAGATLNTPLKQLTTGVAFDFAQNYGGGSDGNHPPYWYGHQEADVLVAGLYANYKATDKLSFNGRAEYIYGQDEHAGHGSYYPYAPGDTYSYDRTPSTDGFEVTGTVEYDLWANVITRVEARWDHANSDVSSLGDYLANRDSVGLYANVIYKF